jgi:putative SOS response-associated peptidase YedK
MCGRYIANSEDEIMEIREILKQISMRFINADSPTPALTEIFPTNRVMVLTKCQLSTVKCQLQKWGIEKWDKKGVIINAKSETYEQSRFFNPFANNRCLVPAHGYYEWGKSLAAQNKAKYAFTSGAKHGIFMCGIHDKQGDFTIITKPADENISYIHPRMPLIVRAEQAADWLNGRLAVDDIESVGVDREEVIS